ncbi:DUF4240 domain-containing protein [uncultured Deinococcus sp.]|uniref:DUF4240 domain-containing protein n=1 Tax=uncultured Deinococcus sp. TaxID=158789 RepID=UPI00258C0738|nr:DUF4240 domain-containing protein [uncultured Deinococcus sp.]
MTEAEKLLWGVLGESDRAAPGGLEARTDHISQTLAEGPAERVAEFGRQMDAALERANTWALWGAAFIINGGASADGFLYFRGWLLMQGRKVFDAAVNNPETLAGVSGIKPDECEWEDILYLPAHLYQQVTGQALPPSGHRPEGDPAGTPWQEDELEQRFPKLWAAFGAA